MQTFELFLSFRSDKTIILTATFRVNKPEDAAFDLLSLACLGKILSRSVMALSGFRRQNEQMTHNTLAKLVRDKKMVQMSVHVDAGVQISWGH